MHEKNSQTPRGHESPQEKISSVLKALQADLEKAVSRKRKFLHILKNKAREAMCELARLVLPSDFTFLYVGFLKFIYLL